MPMLMRFALTLLLAVPLLGQSRAKKKPVAPVEHFGGDSYVTSLRKEAEAGDLDSMYYLSQKLVLGEGMPKNKPEAVSWARKAAELGHASAQSLLGLYYRQGEGVKQDLAEAYVWYSVASANDWPGAPEDRDAVAGKLPRKILEDARLRAIKLHAEIKAKAANRTY